MSYKDNLCIVKYIDGKQFICMPDGKIIPGQVMSSVTDQMNEFAIATIELYINLDNVEVIKEK